VRRAGASDTLVRLNAGGRTTIVTFIPRTVDELNAMSDDGLVAHLQRARAAGAREQVTLVVWVLVQGHWHRIRGRVALKVRPEDVDHVTTEIAGAAVLSTFHGNSVGEFHSWLNTITDRRIADHHRQRQRQPRTVELVVVHGDNDRHAVTEPVDVSQDGYVETKDAVERVLKAMNPKHARAVEDHLLRGLPAREVARKLGLTADNVAQIASRFRKMLRRELAFGEEL
jgi:RNA polymerase sigma factor (sigma-70 family)